MKTTLLFTLLALPLLVSAQRYPTGKGTYRAGGGGSFTMADKTDYYEYKLTVTPRFGYFVSDNLLMGFSMNYSVSVDTAFSAAIKFTPQAKYFYKLNSSTFILATAEFGLDRATTYVDPKSIIDHSSVSFGPGVAYYFSRRVGFEVNIITQLYFNPDGSHNNKVYADGGFVLNVLNKNQKKNNPFKKKGDYDIKEDDDD